MKSVAFALAFFFAASAASTQNSRGEITGTVTDPDGGPVAGATVQAKDVATGVIHATMSADNGKYKISDLSVGSYELSVPPIGFTFVAYIRNGLAVEAGETLHIDIRLDWPMNLGTLGDDSYLIIRNRYAGLTGPTPRMPDGKPDFSGIWNGGLDENPEQASALPWAESIRIERLRNNRKDAPQGYCLPGWVFPAGPLLYKIIQTPSVLVQLFELEPHFRQVFLDKQSHPNDPDPTWQGHSIAAWDGDTLVIDTIGFNDRSWLPNSMPHTEALHVVEQYHRPDLSHLDIHVTVDDPGTLIKPWHLHMVWTLAPREEIMESVCSENNQFSQHAAGK